MTAKTFNKIFFVTLAALSFIGSGFAPEFSYAQSAPISTQSAAGATQQAADQVKEQDIDRFLAKSPAVDQVDGYFKLVQLSLRDLGELEELLNKVKAEPDAAIRQTKVAAIQLKIADEKARLQFRRSRLENAEKLYGKGTASARQARLLRVGGPSLKALPAIGIGAGVVFATNAAADQTSEIRGASVNGDGPAPMRLEKSNIGTSDIAELEAPVVRSTKRKISR
ncbi:MAG: hypothetical protein U1E10_17170 [Bdellovibrionales bacterium]|nr:hypothetical protein [Bdellovibrionales bacterium]